MIIISFPKFEAALICFYSLLSGKPITEDEIKNAISADGITSQELIAKFKSRIKTQNKSEFFTTLKKVTRWTEAPGRGKVFYLLNPRPEVAA